MSNLHGHRFGWVRLHKDVLQPHVFFSRCEDCPRPERYLYLKQAELIRSLWQPLVKFLQKTEMICLTTTEHPSRLLCTQPKIGNPYWLAAISPAARWTSAAARSVIFLCVRVCVCVFSSSLLRASPCIGGWLQVSLQSVLAKWRWGRVVFEVRRWYTWQLTSPSCG